MKGWMKTNEKRKGLPERVNKIVKLFGTVVVAMPGPGNYRKVAIEERGERCEICERTREVIVHHIDGDRGNNEMDNLLVVCKTCHREIHKPSQAGQPYDRYTELLPSDSLYGKVGTGGGRARTTISIRPDQKEWLDENSLNLSSYVRQKLDETIENWEGV